MHADLSPAYVEYTAADIDKVSRISTGHLIETVVRDGMVPRECRCLAVSRYRANTSMAMVIRIVITGPVVPGAKYARMVDGKCSWFEQVR
jgi:hypothetical protein